MIRCEMLISGRLLLQSTSSSMYLSERALSSNKPTLRVFISDWLWTQPRLRDDCVVGINDNRRWRNLFAIVADGPPAVPVRVAGPDAFEFEYLDAILPDLNRASEVASADVACLDVKPPAHWNLGRRHPPAFAALPRQWTFGRRSLPPDQSQTQWS